MGSAPLRTESEWITRLRKEVMMSKMTHNFTLSRDEVMELLGGKFAVLQSADKTISGDIIDHCWKMYQNGQGSADHTDKEVFGQTLESFAVWFENLRDKDAKK